jgi:hypothetical protein
MLIQHEFQEEFLADKPKGRYVEANVVGTDLLEKKIYKVPGEAD